MTTLTPSRYPAGHAQAGTIIVDPEDEVLAAMDAMPDPAPKPQPQAAPKVAPVERTMADLLPSATTPQSRPQGTQRAIALGAAAVVLVLAVWAVTRPAQRTSAPPAATTAPAATVAPSPFPTTSTPSTPLPPDTLPRAIVGYFDFTNPSTAVALDRGTHYQVIGRAGTRYVQLATDAGARVWVLAEDAGLVADQSLPDLAPRPTSPPAPPVRPVVQAPAAQAPAVSAPQAPAQVCKMVRVVSGDLPLGEVTSCAATEAEADALAQAAAKKAAEEWKP